MKKLCNNGTSFKRNYPKFDPTNEYDYIFKNIIKNIYYLTKRVELDATMINKKTVAIASHSEVRARVTFRLIGKSKVSKDGYKKLLVTMDNYFCGE